MEKYINQIINADCLDILRELPDKCVDCCITDPPYGTTACKWDSIIPFEPMWKELNRVMKDTGPVLLFGQDKFTAYCMLSNPNHRYNLIWKKGERTSGFLNAKKMPLRNHEDIMVFYRKQTTYNPQMTKGELSHSKGKLNKKQQNNCYGEFCDVQTNLSELKYPKSILNFDRPHPPIHPTQKPVGLIEYLIKTYTNENDIVLDFCSGSGTTAIAALNTGRRFICIEKDQQYWQASVERIKKAQEQMSLF